MSEIHWKESSPALLPEHFNENLVKNWLLVTAGSPDSLGTMTVNWGGSGFIWKQHVVFLVIPEYPAFSKGTSGFQPYYVRSVLSGKTNLLRPKLRPGCR